MHQALREKLGGWKGMIVEKDSSPREVLRRRACGNFANREQRRGKVGDDIK